MLREWWHGSIHDILAEDSLWEWRLSYRLIIKSFFFPLIISMSHLPMFKWGIKLFGGLPFDRVNYRGDLICSMVQYNQLNTVWIAKSSAQTLPLAFLLKNKFHPISPSWYLRVCACACMGVHTSPRQYYSQEDYPPGFKWVNRKTKQNKKADTQRDTE